MTVGTHDVSDVTVRLLQNNTVQVTTVYSRFSTAKGALIYFVNTNETKSAIATLDRNKSNNYILPFPLYPGQYRLLMFDIEHNGTLFNINGSEYPAVSYDFQANGKIEGTYKP